MTKNLHNQERQGRGFHPLTLLISALAAAYLMTAEYQPMVLGALVALLFGAYVWMRMMLFFEQDRFTPKRMRVGLTWALIGIDEDSNEFDRRPVRVYFALLVVLFGGLILRPIVQMVIS